MIRNSKSPIINLDEIQQQRKSISSIALLQIQWFEKQHQCIGDIVLKKPAVTINHCTVMTVMLESSMMSTSSSGLSCLILISVRLATVILVCHFMEIPKKTTWCSQICLSSYASCILWRRRNMIIHQTKDASNCLSTDL